MRRLIGWRTADFLLETTDRDQALNWQAHHEILPIFEGDPNTTLKAAEQPKAPCQWIPVSELMPEIEQLVLVCSEFSGRSGDWRYSVGALDRSLLNDPVRGPWFVKGASWRPSHWMPLPAAPGAIPPAAEQPAMDALGERQQYEKWRRTWNGKWPRPSDPGEWEAWQARASISAAEQPVARRPVAVVDANDDGMWADILPDVSVKVGDLLYASPPAAEQPDTVPAPRALQADDRVPDDFRNQASGYRAGWNDCLAALLGKEAV